jgi:Leucine-rich repeat (LRR) protein
VLHGNALMQLPESITRLTGLRALALSSNRLWQVRSSMGGGRLLSRMRSAHSDGPLPGSLEGWEEWLAPILHWPATPPAALQLPVAIGAMSSLRLLDVSHNMLVRLPSSVGDLEQLHSLKVQAPGEAAGGPALTAAVRQVRHRRSCLLCPHAPGASPSLAR